MEIYSDIFETTEFQAPDYHHERMPLVAREHGLMSAVRQASHSLIRTTEIICRSIHKIDEGYEPDWFPHTKDEDEDVPNWFVDVYLKYFPEIETLRSKMLESTTPTDVAGNGISYLGALTHYLQCEVVNISDSISSTPTALMWQKTAVLATVHLRRSTQFISTELQRTDVEESDLEKSEWLSESTEKFSEKVALCQMVKKMNNALDSRSDKIVWTLARSPCPFALFEQ